VVSTSPVQVLQCAQAYPAIRTQTGPGPPKAPPWRRAKRKRNTALRTREHAASLNQLAQRNRTPAPSRVLSLPVGGKREVASASTYTFFDFGCQNVFRELMTHGRGFHVSRRGRQVCHRAQRLPAASPLRSSPTPPVKNKQDYHCTLCKRSKRDMLSGAGVEWLSFAGGLRSVPGSRLLALFDPSQWEVPRVGTPAPEAAGLSRLIVCLCGFNHHIWGMG
jgi:hypothetical protein